MAKKKKRKQKKQSKPKLNSFVKMGARKERDYIVENLAMLVGSGMDIGQSLKAVQRGVSLNSTKKALDFLIHEVDSGSYLHEAMKDSEIFSDHEVSLIEIGEDSGRLSENLDLVSTQNKKEARFKSQIRSAMLYPVFVLSVTFIVAIGIAWFVLPKLAQVFKRLKVDLPALTKGVLYLGQIFSEYGTWLGPSLLFGMMLFIYLVFYFKPTKVIGQWLLIHTPTIKTLVVEIEMARFGSLLSGLLSAGMPILEAIRSIEVSTEFKAYQKFYKHLGNSIKVGNSFNDSFKKYDKIDRLMPVPIQQVIVTSEQSASLEESLRRIGEDQTQKTEITAKNLTVLLEPILLVLVWVGVMLLALAIILPIYNIIGGIRQPQTVAPPPPAPEAPTDEKLIEVEESIAENVEYRELQILETGVGYLNVRQEPSTEAELIQTVLPGEIYQFIQTEQDWYQIQFYDGQTGWVSSEYVTEINKDE